MGGVKIEEITEEDELNNQEPIRPSTKRKHDDDEKEYREPIIEEPDEPIKKKPKKGGPTKKKQKKSRSTDLMSSMFGGFLGGNDFFFGGSDPFFDDDDDDDSFGDSDDFFGMSGFGGFDDDDNGGGGNYQCFSSSTSSTITYDRNGTPHIREKTSTSKNLNGVVKEKINTLRDSDSGVEKINLERHIGGKSKKIEKVRVGGGAIESSESTKGMTQEEAANFEDDWEKVTSNPKGLIKSKKSKRPKLLEN